MKILHVCLANFFIDGHSYQENMLTKYHKINGFEVEVLASHVSFDKNGEFTLLKPQKPYYNEYGIKVTRLNYKFKNKFCEKLRLYQNTYKEIEKSNPDIIFIHGCQFIDIFKIIDYLEKKKRQNKKIQVFVDNHADYSNSATNWISENILHKKIWRFCASQIEPYTEKFYGVLPARVNFLKEVYQTPSNKTELLVMGADDRKIDFNNKKEIRKRVRSEFGIDENDFLIVTGGKIDKAKVQTLNLLQAVRDLNGSVKIILFGSIVEELKKPIMDFVDNKNIFYLGWIDSVDSYDYFLSSDLGVFPGRHSVLWEQAVGTGLPCIFKYWKGTDHVDVGGNCEFLYDDTTEEIYFKLKDILTGDKYKIMKNKAIVNGIGTFSYNDISRKSLGLNEVTDVKRY